MNRTCNCPDCTTFNCQCTEEGGNCSDCLCEDCGTDETIESDWADMKQEGE